MPSLFIAPTHAPAFTRVLHKLPLPFMYANSNAVGIDVQLIFQKYKNFISFITVKYVTGIAFGVLYLEGVFWHVLQEHFAYGGGSFLAVFGQFVQWIPTLERQCFGIDLGVPQ